MTDQTQEARGRPGRRRRLLSALLALAILIPLGALFLGHHRDLSEQRSMAAQERQGIEYLLALSALTTALTDARSAAVRGERVSRETLDGPLADVAEVDERFGDQLRVRERWSQLRDRIEQVTGTDHADGRAAHAAYEEATVMLLGLHDRLRETTGLVRDPDADAYHLQDAAGNHLPATIVALGQLVDLVTLTAAEPAAEQAAGAPEISAAAAAATAHSDELVVGVQSALDSTESRSLSSAVLGKYDRFLRAKDGLLATVPPDGSVEEVDLGLIAMFRGELRAAGDDLHTTLLVELDTLIGTRAGELARSRWTAIASVSIGVLLAFGVAAVSLVRGARQLTGDPRQGQLPAGSGGNALGGGSGSGNGREPSRPRTPISDTAAGSEPRPGTPPAGDRLAGELLGSERVDVR